MSWVGLTEDEARERHPNVVVIQMPPKGIAHEDIPLPVAEGTMLVWMRYYKGLSAKNLLQVTVDGILLTLEIIQVSLVREVKMWHELVCKQLES